MDRGKSTIGDAFVNVILLIALVYFAAHLVVWLVR